MMKSNMVTMIVRIENSIGICCNSSNIIGRIISLIGTRQITAQVNKYFGFTGRNLCYTTTYLVCSTMDGDFHILSNLSLTR